MQLLVPSNKQSRLDGRVRKDMISSQLWYLFWAFLQNCIAKTEVRRTRGKTYFLIMPNLDLEQVGFLETHRPL